MSADAWRHCPRCTAREQQRLDAEEARVDELYGQVPVDEFARMRATLTAEREAFGQRQATFREDYEIFGAEDGRVHVTYGGSCQKCGLSLSFSETHEIPDWNL